MKILVFTDSHGNKSSIKRIIEKSKEVDIVVCAGDLSNFSIDLDVVLNQLKAIKKPLLIIIANSLIVVIPSGLVFLSIFFMILKNTYMTLL